MLSKNSFLRQTILRPDLQFYAPNYLFTELFKHKERILYLSSETEQNIDEADTPFVALTIELSAVLWTGDKRLKDGLQKQGFNHFLVVSNP